MRGELGEQGILEIGTRSGDDDRVERRLIGPAEPAIVVA
jgi:hypothetical protein